MTSVFWNWTRVGLLLGLTLSFGPIHAKAELGADVWAWLDVTVWKNADSRFHLFSHQAMADGRGPIVQLISPRFKHRIQPWLELGTGFSMLRIERGGGDESVFDQVRPELECNPILQLGKCWTIHFRNRAEIRWNDWQGEPRPRMRHRLQVTRSLEDFGLVTAVYLSNEWLVELDRGDWTENRAVPVGMTFTITKKTAVDFFYMVRSFRFDDGWTSDHVVGVFLKLTL